MRFDKYLVAVLAGLAFFVVARVVLVPQSLPESSAEETADSREALRAEAMWMVDKEIAELRVTIRNQDVEVAVAERKVAESHSESGRLEIAKKELAAAAAKLEGTIEAHNEGLVSEQGLRSAELEKSAKESELTAMMQRIATHDAQLAVHDAKIERLKLKADVAEWQLRRVQKEYVFLRRPGTQD